MKDKASYAIELDRAMYGFLEEMAKKYDLADPDKALRCLVNYARAEPAQADAIFAEVRCLDC
ncbi:MAG: hypothetical protein HYX69_02025 [Planctomycetia bacterium]|nr:hypothetical protein [Planctomycetia bacterium]